MSKKSSTFAAAMEKRKYIYPTTEVVMCQTERVMDMASASDKGEYGMPELKDPGLKLF